MALVLHLTDLHLGGRADEQILDDYKSDIVPYAERVTREQLLRSTLRGLARYLRIRGEVLDAVVVSGDITVADDLAGFNKLPDVLSELGDVTPVAGRIVIVPGNHDVTWGTPASSMARYQHFIDSVRSKGYITPLLDGIDLPVVGASKDNQHHVALDEGRIEIVPLNSSNYCGTIEPLRGVTEDLWTKIPALFSASDQEALRRELKRLRQYDVARFSPQQLDAVSRLLDRIPPSVTGRRAIRVAVLHHQLLPVSASEEFKPYESIVNLGLVRKFLRSNRFEIVLHGHKHTGAVYWDDFFAFDRQPEDHSEPIRSLIVSGATVGGVDSQRGEICRLIRIDATTLAPEVIVMPVPGIESGASLEGLKRRRFPLWDRSGICIQSADATKVIEAESFDEAYDQVVGYFAELSEHDLVNNLICEVRNPNFPVKLPLRYPEVPGKTSDERQDWVDDLVRWWQRPATVLDDPFGFTHGQRIHRYSGNTDQFAGALSALEDKSSTSRAVVNLVDPPKDGWDSQRKAPSFCSFQFVIAKRGKELVLNCLAYFRKQEMRYWWPVNYAELALMQKTAVERLSGAYSGLRPGAIVTVAAIAYGSQSVPKVAVPIVDRLLDEDPDTLWQLAYALVWPGFPARPDIRKKWERLLEDLIPDPKPDPDGAPVAIHGLRDLMKEIGRFMRFNSGKDLYDVHSAIGALLQTNTLYMSETTTKEASHQRHNSWREECYQVVQRLRGAIERCWLNAEAGIEGSKNS